MTMIKNYQKKDIYLQKEDKKIIDKLDINVNNTCSTIHQIKQLNYERKIG